MNMFHVFVSTPAEALLRMRSAMSGNPTRYVTTQTMAMVPGKRCSPSKHLKKGFDLRLPSSSQTKRSRSSGAYRPYIMYPLLNRIAWRYPGAKEQPIVL